MGWIKNIYDFLKLRRELLKDYKKEDLCAKFTKTYGVEFKTDWAARLYAVVNPALQNIRDNGTTQIFEYGQDGLTDKTYIKHWIMERLIVVEKYIAATNLLDILLFDMREITMDGKPTGNYLVTFTPYNFPMFKKSWKRLAALLGGLLVAAAIISIIIF